MIVGKAFFFTPTINNERFLSQNEPTEQVMRNLLDSVPFKIEASDTATETQQGLVETATLAEFNAGIDNNSNGFALYVRPSHIKSSIDNVVASFNNQISNILIDISDLQGDVVSLNSQVSTLTTMVVTGFQEQMPIGSMIMYPVASVPNPKWMRCEGQSLSTGAYPQLFALIGYSFGGSGALFNLPDTRQKFISGYDASGALEYQVIGQGAGQDSVSLTKDQLPKHTHEKGTISATTANDGTHNHSFTGSGNDGSGSNTGIRTTQDNSTSSFDSGWIHDDGLHNHAVTVSGSTEDGTIDGLQGNAHENRPSFVVFPMLIKVLN